MGPIHLNEIDCTGFEKSLTDCKFNMESQGCNHEEDAAVRCNVPAMGFQNQVREAQKFKFLKFLASKPTCNPCPAAAPPLFALTFTDGFWFFLPYSCAWLVVATHTRAGWRCWRNAMARCVGARSAARDGAPWRPWWCAGSWGWALPAMPSRWVPIRVYSLRWHG